MPTYQNFLAWARLRETLSEQDDFYVYREAFDEKAKLILDGLEIYFGDRFDNIYYNAALHYIICSPYNFMQGGVEHKNDLYDKYKIDDKRFITSSASDESSSASIHTTKSLNDGDFLMTDLCRTPYGEYIYSILEQLNIWPVLL